VIVVPQPLAKISLGEGVDAERSTILVVALPGINCILLPDPFLTRAQIPVLNVCLSYFL